MTPKRRKKKFLKKIKHTFFYPLFFALVMGLRLILSIMPEKWVFFIMEHLAHIVFICARKERSKTLHNLRTAFHNEYSEAQIRRLAQQVFVNLGRNLAEICIWNRFTTEELKKRVAFNNLHYCYDLAEKKTYGIVIAAHCGNWELLPKALGAQNLSATLIARELRFKWLDRFFVRLRESPGYTVLYRANASRESMRQLKKRSNFLAILPDQDIKTIEGIFVDFFGKRAYTPTSPVKLALAANVPLVPIMFNRDDDNKFHHTVTVYPPIYLEGNKNDSDTIKKYTQMWSTIIESHIRNHPSQWVWMHNRWKTTPEKIVSEKGTAQ